MITSQGKNGAKVIHVDIVVPQSGPEHTDDELELMAIGQELDRLAGDLSVDELDAGVFDKVKAVVKRAKDAATKAKDHVIKKISNAGASSTHPPGQMVVEFSAKYYEHMDKMTQAVAALVEALVKIQINNQSQQAAQEDQQQAQTGDTAAAEDTSQNGTAAPLYYMIERCGD